MLALENTVNNDNNKRENGEQKRLFEELTLN